MDAEKLVASLLDRIERNAVGSAKRFRMFQEAHKQRLLASEALAAERGKTRTNEAIIRLATDKIDEWEKYGANLRAVIDALDPTGRKRKVGLPHMPKPFELQIPF